MFNLLDRERAIRNDLDMKTRCRSDLAFAATLCLLSFQMTTQVLEAKDSEKDPPPHPRTPATRSFETLESRPSISLGRQYNVEFLRSQPRYGAEDYSLNPPSVPPLKTDDKTFYGWLIQKRLPREFAEMLYLGAPETTFLEGTGYINGVDTLIEENSDPERKNIQDAGFFIVGSGANGDMLVVDLNFRKSGEVGYFPVETMWDKTPAQLREMFIPISKNLGDYIRICNSNERDIASDYWDAKERKEREKK